MSGVAEKEIVHLKLVSTGAHNGGGGSKEAREFPCGGM